MIFEGEVSWNLYPVADTQPLGEISKILSMDDVVMATTTIKDEVHYSDGVQNTECMNNEIPQPASEDYCNTNAANESVSSIKIKCEPLIEMSSSPQPPMKKIKKESDSFETLNQSVTKLHKFPVMRSCDVVEDEYYYFAMHIVSQLRTLPTRSFIILQERIQSLVTEERLKVLASPDQTGSTTPSSFVHISSPSYNFQSGYQSPSPYHSSQFEKIK
ncbi:unnamed protein product [Nezara viridula]|uniref:BESS domain-containing protein n=1 Tax=Nezara viridula TaxID=85310 RepID=A0A9P0MRG9_NEZVI|nr:unnamed protein product [Nezara viridula]